MSTLGLRENWKQFSLLVIINGFVGGMIGLERTIIPQLAEQEFNMSQTGSILSFIAVFGVSKAITNYYTGAFANRIGRKKLLILGWLVAVPIPLILMYTNTWNGVILANILLGINQGITWTSTVVMKIDLVGEKNRGLAMGINESVGYLAVGLVAFATGWIAAEFGVRPYPFYLGIGFAALGFILSLFTRDTKHHVASESSTSNKDKIENIFVSTTFADRNLSSITQAGMVNNLNDGMVWGLLPILLASLMFDLEKIGVMVAVYPVVWGLGQLVTGKMADHYNKKTMMVAGMIIQGISILGMAVATGFYQFIVLGALLGIGTALVYPTFLAALAFYSHPTQRAGVIGVYRFWRDLGYAIGAILTGILVGLVGMQVAVISIGLLTIFSGIIILLRMR